MAAPTPNSLTHYADLWNHSRVRFTGRGMPRTRGSSWARFKPFKASLWTALPWNFGADGPPCRKGKQLPPFSDANRLRAWLMLAGVHQSETMSAIFAHQPYGTIAIFRNVSRSKTDCFPKKYFEKNSAAPTAPAESARHSARRSSRARPGAVFRPAFPTIARRRLPCGCHRPWESGPTRSRARK